MNIDSVLLFTIFLYRNNYKMLQINFYVVYNRFYL